MTFVKGKVKTVYETDNPEEIIIQYEDKVTAGNGRKNYGEKVKVLSVVRFLESYLR